MTQFTARQGLGKHILAEVNARNNRRAVFSVVHAALVAKQRCGKDISTTVNQHATIEKTVFSVMAAPRLYNEQPVWRRVRIPASRRRRRKGKPVPGV
jgi:hypothetical protein